MVNRKCIVQKLRNAPSKLLNAALAAILSSTCATGILAAAPQAGYAASLPTKIVNGDFEYNRPTGAEVINARNTWWCYVFPSDSTFGNTAERYAMSGFDANAFGWKSTSPIGAVEIQTSYVYDATWTSGRSCEIVADAPGISIYQDISTVPGGVYKWSLKHAAYHDWPRVDIMQVMIGAPGREVAQNATRTRSNGYDPVGFVGTNIASTLTASMDWKNRTANSNTYAGTWICPAGQTTTRFTFKSIQSVDEDTGNIVDDISFNIYQPLLYDANGGTVASGQNTTIAQAQANDYAGYFEQGTTKALSTAQPTRSGYTFLGWMTSKTSPATNKAEYDALAARCVKSVQIAARTNTVYAAWAKNPTITYTDRGQVISTQTVPPGTSTASLAPAPFRHEGYSFLGYESEPDHVWQDVTCEARWAPDHYNVFFDRGGGAGHMDKDIAKTGEPYEVPMCAYTKDGYVFCGWKHDGFGILQPGETATNLAGPGGISCMLVAQWTPNAYMIAYDAHGGIGEMANQECVYDETASLAPCTFTNPGHGFKGWSTDPIGSVEYEDSAIVLNLTSEPDGTVTLYAVWNEDADVRIAYDANDSEHVSLTRSEEDVAPSTGDAAGCTATPARGYVFEGWHDVEGNRIADVAKLEPARGEDGLWHAAEYIAHVRPAGYAISFDGSGGEAAPEAMAAQYDDQLILPLDVPSYGTRGFLGWSETPGGPVAFQPGDAIMNLTEEDGAEITLYAVWGPEIFQVTFSDGAGATLKVEEVEAGASATPPADPERYGWTFIGWSEPFDAVTRDLVIEAKWEQIFHHVIWKDGMNSVIAEADVPHGEAATPPEDPARKGLAFMGWDVDTSCIKADVIVNARWAGTAAAVLPDAATPLSKGLPQTGDALGLALMALTLLGGAAAGGAFVLRKKIRASNNTGNDSESHE